MIVLDKLTYGFNSHFKILVAYKSKCLLVIYSLYLLYDGEGLVACSLRNLTDCSFIYGFSIDLCVSDPLTKIRLNLAYIQYDWDKADELELTVVNFFLYRKIVLR